MKVISVHSVHWFWSTLWHLINCCCFLQGKCTELNEPSPALNWPQKVQNNAARLVRTSCEANENRTKLLPFQKNYIGPYPLQNCHTSFQALWQFSSSIPFRTASHPPALWNSSVQQGKLLIVPKTNLKVAGNRSFHFQAAKIQNSLPTNVCSSPSFPSFKKSLKTHIFKEHFSLGL